MKKQNHFTALREHLYMTMTLCRYVAPGTVVAEIEAPQFMNMKRRAGRTSYYLQAVARTLKDHPRMNAGFVRSFWTRKSRLVYFDTVDAALSVDKKFGDERYPFMFVIRNCDQLTVEEIEAKIRYAVTTPVEQIPEFQRFLKFLSLPKFIRKLILLRMISSEERMKATIGTFSFTNISLWGFESASLNVPRLLVGVGKHDGDKVKIGYGFNHVITDGAQLGEFHRDLSRRIIKCDFI